MTFGIPILLKVLYIKLYKWQRMLQSVTTFYESTICPDMLDF